MKFTIILSAFVAIFSLVGAVSAQTSGLRLTFSEAIELNGRETGSITFTGLENPNMQVFEALVPAATESDCFASTDFTTARVVGSDRASLTYDAATGSYKLKWTRAHDKRDSCRVLVVGQTVAAGDLAMWQSNYGTGGFVESAPSDSIRGDGPVRPIRYAISLNPASSPMTLSVKYPAQDGEVIEATFPDAPDRNFLIFEAILPASTEAECLASTDFSAAMPADRNRASAIYDPQTALWHLRNSIASSVSPCRALLADGDGILDAADYVVWRTNLGNSGFADSARSLRDRSTQSDSGAVRARQAQITYAFSPVITNQ